MTITYIKKNVYGKETLYIEGNEAIFVNKLTGKKTVNESDLANLKSLGLTVVYKAS